MNEQWQEDRNDDISKLFRDNEKELEETPSLRAWNKLERKLDRRRTDKRKVIYRYTSMIAASIAVLAMIYTIGLLDKISNSSESMAKNTETNNLSEKSIAENENPNPIDLIEEEGILEMESGTEADYKKIIPNDNLNNSKPIAGNFSDDPMVEKRGSATKIVADANPQKDNQSSRSFVVKQNEAVTDKNNDNKFEFPSVATAEVEEKIVPANTKEEVKESETYDYVNEEVVVESKVNAQGNPYLLEKSKEPRNQSSKKTSVPSSKKKEEESLTKEKTDKVTKTYSINQFDWMDGNWKDASISGSFDTWKKVKDGLNGSGSVIINEDTFFVEKMRIYQRGSDIFFEGSVDATQKIFKFKLESYEGNEAVFSRKNSGFPNQVVITKHNNNSYSIVYENKDSVKLDSAEQLYFKYRNRLDSQRAARNMARY